MTNAGPAGAIMVPVGTNMWSLQGPIWGLKEICRGPIWELKGPIWRYRDQYGVCKDRHELVDDQYRPTRTN